MLHLDSYAGAILQPEVISTLQTRRLLKECVNVLFTPIDRPYASTVDLDIRRLTPQAFIRIASAICTPLCFALYTMIIYQRVTILATSAVTLVVIAARQLILDTLTVVNMVSIETPVALILSRRLTVRNEFSTKYTLPVLEYVLINTLDTLVVCVFRALIYVRESQHMSCTDKQK